MSTPETVTRSAQDSPSLWQRSVWPHALCVSLPLFMLSLTVRNWLPPEGRWVGFGRTLAGAVIGVAVALILIKVDKVRDLRRQRREAEAEPRPEPEQ